MQNDKANDPQKHGGYGDSTGGQDPNAPRPNRTGSAGGRDDVVSDAMDADEALGNRTGGYGGNPSSVEDEADTK